MKICSDRAAHATDRSGKASGGAALAQSCGWNCPLSGRTLTRKGMPTHRGAARPSSSLTLRFRRATMAIAPLSGADDPGRVLRHKDDLAVPRSGKPHREWLRAAGADFSDPNPPKSPPSKTPSLERVVFTNHYGNGTAVFAVQDSQRSGPARWLMHTPTQMDARVGVGKNARTMTDKV